MPMKPELRPPVSKAEKTVNFVQNSHKNVKYHNKVVKNQKITTKKVSKK